MQLSTWSWFFEQCVVNFSNTVWRVFTVYKWSTSCVLLLTAEFVLIHSFWSCSQFGPLIFISFISKFITCKLDSVFHRLCRLQIFHDVRRTLFDFTWYWLAKVQQFTKTQILDHCLILWHVRKFIVIFLKRIIFFYFLLNRRVVENYFITIKHREQLIFFSFKSGVRWLVDM